MDLETYKFVRSILPEGRTVFHVFEDRYAFMLLEAAAEDGVVDLSKIKNGRFKSLLTKPRVREFISKFGKPRVDADELKASWPHRGESYRLTVGMWPELDEYTDPDWDQTTRGGRNLVLQMNLPNSHKRALAKYVPNWEDSIRWPIHPIATDGELTMAWARIDLDLETKEALIEEIQSDWVWDTKVWAAREDKDAENWGMYVDEVLSPVSRKWPETMLTAAVWFLTVEMGIRTIFYHTHESGKKLKRIGGTAPPRSLYTSLPKKFCFELTHNGPLFIRDSNERTRKDLKKLFVDPSTQWYILKLD